MRSMWLSVSLVCFLAVSVCTAEQVHCSLQKPVASTEADAAFLSGEFAHAEALFTAQVIASPTVADFSGLVRSQLEQNKLPEAMVSAEKAVAAFTTSADAEALLGDVLTRSGRIADALLAYKKALALDICSAHAHFGYAKLERLNVAYATARQQLSVAHKLAPNDPEITAAFIEAEPVAERLPALQAFLASSAKLPPAALELLNTAAAILAQGKFCITTGKSAPERIALLPVLYDGTFARSWGLKSRLNNASSPLLELDTSVSGIVLSASEAQKAGVKPLIAGAASASGPYTGYLDVVHLGDLSYRDCPVRVVPNSMLANSNSLIGTDFFRDRLIHIDYVASAITLNPLPTRPGGAADDASDRIISPEQKDWSAVYISGPAVLVPTLINDKGPVMFMLDTGNYRSVISPAVASEQLIASRDATLMLRGSVGQIVKVLFKEGGGDVNRTDIRSDNGQLIRVTTPLKVPVYRFTNNIYPDYNSISFDLSPVSHQVGTEVSGLLGFGVLQGYSIDIDYRDGLARVVFDQNRRYQTRNSEGFY